MKKGDLGPIPDRHDDLESSKSPSQRFDLAGFGHTGHEQGDEGTTEKSIRQCKYDETGMTRVVVEW